MMTSGVGRTYAEAALQKARARSQRGFYAALAGGSPGARLVRRPGVQATLVPVRPWFSVLNSVLFDHPQALRAALPEIGRTYRAADVHAWRVWVAPEHEVVTRSLVEDGYAPAEASPLCMGAPIAAIDLEPRVELDLEPRPSWETVARCNDRAYGVLQPWSLAAAFATMDDSATHLHAARRDGEVVSALLAREQEGDCYFWFVATAPQARGEGLASELMRHALRQAVKRGCTTTSLEASAMGESAYARLGYQALGRFAIFERQEP